MTRFPFSDLVIEVTTGPLMPLFANAVLNAFRSLRGEMGRGELVSDRIRISRLEFPFDALGVLFLFLDVTVVHSVLVSFLATFAQDALAGLGDWEEVEEEVGEEEALALLTLAGSVEALDFVRSRVLVSMFLETFCKLAICDLVVDCQLAI